MGNRDREAPRAAAPPGERGEAGADAGDTPPLRGRRFKEAGGVKGEAAADVEAVLRALVRGALLGVRGEGKSWPPEEKGECGGEDA